MGQFKLVVSVLLCLGVLVVILQNTEAVETRLLFVTVTMPRAVLVAVAFLAGAATGLLVAGRLARRAGQKDAATRSS